MNHSELQTGPHRRTARPSFYLIPRRPWGWVVAVGLALLLFATPLLSPLGMGWGPSEVALAQTRTQLAVVRAGGADLLDTPGGAVQRTLSPGTAFDAVGRSSDGLWVVGAARLLDGAVANGWIATTRLVIFDVDTLPVMFEVGGGAGDGGSMVGATSTDALSEATATPTAAIPATATATVTPFPTPSPTVTPSPSPTPSPTSTPSPTPLPPSSPTPDAVTVVDRTNSLLAVVGTQGTTLRDSVAGTPILDLAMGAVLDAVGRTADNDWIFARTVDGRIGWAPIGGVLIFGVESLPVLNAPTAAQPAQPAQSARPVQVASMPPASEGVQAAPAQSGPTGVVDTGGSGLYMRSGPGPAYAILGRLTSGQTVALSGRNQSATWLQVQTGGGDDVAWVARAYVRTDLDVAQLPVSTQVGSGAARPDSMSGSAPLIDGNSSQAAPGAAVLSTRPGSTGLTGKLVFQASTGGTIYLYDLSSDTQRSLTSGYAPSLSPDGQWVAFLRGGGENGLYRISVDGRTEQRLYTGGEQLRTPSWSPDGGYIVFSRLTGYQSCRNVGFGFCLPDGPGLGKFPLQQRELRTLSRVDQNGENFRDLASDLTAISPDWNEAGIVYSSRTGLHITQDKEDAENKVLIQASLYDDPVWRPDGSEILFQSQEGNHRELFVINPDGQGLRALTRPNGLLREFPQNVAPAWSPDGSQIVFLSNREGGGNTDNEWSFWVMDAQGGALRTLPISAPIEYAFQAEQVVDWGR